MEDQQSPTLNKRQKNKRSKDTTSKSNPAIESMNVYTSELNMEETHPNCYASDGAKETK